MAEAVDDPNAPPLAKFVAKAGSAALYAPDQPQWCARALLHAGPC